MIHHWWAQAQASINRKMRMCAVQRRVPVEAQALKEKRKSINMEETLLAYVKVGLLNRYWKKP